MNTKLMSFVAVVIAVVSVLLLAQQFGWIGTASTTGEGGTGGSGVISVQSCPEDITLKYNDYDVSNRANDPASNLRLYSPDRGNISDDGTDTVGTNVQLNAIAGYLSTTYYGKFVDIKTDCKDPEDLAVPVEKAGSLTLTVVNKDGITKNTPTTSTALSGEGGNNQSIGANEIVELTLTMDVATQSFWGASDAEGKSIVVAQYAKNDSIDSVNFETLDGTRLSVAPIPASFQYMGNNGSRTGSNAYYVPNVKNGGENKLKIIIDSGSSNPNGQTPITLNFFDANAFLNLETLEKQTGVEDVNNQLRSLKQTNITVLYS